MDEAELMYTCRHFAIQELVPRETYDARGQRAWELLDSRILKMIDLIRDDFGPVIVNNWNSGGSLQYRGFRPHDATVGARLSQHRYGRAIDFHTPDTPLEEVYKAVLSGKYWQITTVEDIEHTPTWLHIDCRNHRGEGVKVVKP